MILKLPLAVMMRFAEIFERPRPELVPVAAVRLGVVNHGGRRHDLADEAPLTKRLARQTIEPESLPSRSGVPFPPLALVCHPANARSGAEPVNADRTRFQMRSRSVGVW